MWRDPDLFAVPVQGGRLTAGRWGSGRHLVLASHGITANHRSFGQLAARFDGSDADVTLVAVDHRGRGGSAALPGPYGPTAHARDLIAVLDHLDVDRATLVGHSMGGFIAANAAAGSPGRVQGLVVVDGALAVPVQLPPGTEVEAVVRHVIGPALDRLDRDFASPDAYVEHWQAHPAFQDWNDVADAYVRYDLVEDGEVWRSPVSKEAVLADGQALLIDETARTAIERVTVPTTLLLAPRGLLDEPPGMYPPEVVASLVARLPDVTAVEVPDTNHYSILFGETGAARIADAVLTSIAGAD